MNLSKRALFCFFLFLASGIIIAQNLNSQQSYNLQNEQFKIEIVPETFEVVLVPVNGNEKSFISIGQSQKRVENINTDSNKVSWEFPDLNILVNLEINQKYLDIEITSNSNGQFTFPCVGNGIYNMLTLPMHQGKNIPVDDKRWVEHMVTKGALTGLQDLSMQFFGVNYPDYALVYIIKNKFNNKISFKKDENSRLAFDFVHEFPTTVKNNTYGFRVYLSENNPTSIAKVYKNYIKERNEYVTLEDKAKSNPNIRKLYGAQHIYLWDAAFIIEKNIKGWKQFKTYFISENAKSEGNPTKHIMALFNDDNAELGKEFLASIDEFSNSKYISQYHKRIFVKALNEVLFRKDFYNADAWNKIEMDEETKSLLNKGILALNNSELYQLNKRLLYQAYREYLYPINTWGNGVSNYILKTFKANGIDKAWLGLDDWIPAEINPDFVAKANEMGYLVGPYDSYHSIHEPGNEKWITAKFKDTTLYNNATVLGKNGTKKTGFLGRGRKLNPTLAMPAVRNRVNRIMGEGLKLNSWFIDCDATGEFYDDYSKGRMTNQEDDMEARLERMAWIRDSHKLVVGSEVGNDFSAGTIAYAHGMTTPVIDWGDPDLRKNKKSKYYLGSYFSRAGGVPSKYIKQVPLKEKHQYFYFDNRFNIPLFQLVYNNSVITSHHWEMGTLKAPSEIKNQKLKEVLYNVPPLYHIDIPAWEKYKESIVHHNKVFSKTHMNAVKLEMTSFNYLDDKKKVQQTIFGNGSIRITANFSEEPFNYKEEQILPKTLLVEFSDGRESIMYAPIE